MYTPNDDRLIRALRASRDARLTGALRVEARTEGGILFFDGGSVYFGVIDGHKPTPASFEKDGITREMLNDASRAPRADDRFADALMSVGAPATNVRAFGRRSITTALARFARLQDAQFTADDRSHPYGPAFTFEVDELLEAIGVLPSSAPPPPPEPEPKPTVDPFANESQGLGFRRRTGLRAAALAAQSDG